MYCLNNISLSVFWESELSMLKLTQIWPCMHSVVQYECVWPENTHLCLNVENIGYVHVVFACASVSHCMDSPGPWHQRFKGCVHLNTRRKGSWITCRHTCSRVWKGSRVVFHTDDPVWGRVTAPARLWLEARLGWNLHMALIWSLGSSGYRKHAYQKKKKKNMNRPSVPCFNSAAVWRWLFVLVCE